MTDHLGRSVASPEHTSSRECPWCNEPVRVRKDGALVVHRWDVRQGGDDPVWARCVGSGTTNADALAAGWKPEPTIYTPGVLDDGINYDD